MLPWKLRKRQILPVNQNRLSVYFSLAKFQFLGCNLSLAMIWQMTYAHELPKLCSATLSKGVFERSTPTGSDVFFILKHLDATKFVFLSVFTIIETICQKNCAKPAYKIKRPLPVDVRRSKTSLLKLTNMDLMIRQRRRPWKRR